MLTIRCTIQLLLVLALKVAFGADRGIVQKNLPCPEGCTDRGNCNAETGRCECPWGFTGPACKEDRMAACRQTPDDPGSCGTLWPKHCECYRACQLLYCGSQWNQDNCAHEMGRELPYSRCWRLKDAAAPVNSQLPEGGVELASVTTWYRHFPRAVTGEPQYTTDLEAERDKWGISNWSGGHVARPLDACPGRCSNGRGACLKWGHETEPRCMCRKGFNGTDCSQLDNHEACWFAPDCGGRGSCKSGFCHCQPGYFGVGCHRSAAYRPETAGQVPDARPVTQLKIYMYDLPWHLAFPYEYNDGHFGRDDMYKAYEYFMRYFLNDTVVRTENPYEANLFYVPMLLYFYVGNVKDPVPHASAVLDHIKREWPFYNRSGGRDHFYFMTGDRGACHVPRWMQDECIKLVHFGMQRAGLPWGDVKNKDYACMQMKRDLVIPPINMFREVLPVDTVEYYKWLVSNGGRDGNRTLLFFFAGGLGSSQEYSGGVRQAIKTLLDSLKPKPPDVEFIDGRTQNYKEMLLKSKFCIAPYGYGWGLRLVQAMEFGCIPLIIQDNVYQAFEDFLPYEDFSVRMPLADVPRMVEILRSFSEEQLASLRLGMARHFRAFIWNREWGGKAYEWTLAGLQRRLDNMRAELFHRRRRRGG